MDVIHATPEPHFYEDALCNALENPDSEYDRGQLIELACLIAQLGNEKARDIAYRAVEKRFVEGCPWDADALIKMDGLTGYAFAARLMMTYPPGEDDAPDYLLFDEIGKQFGKESIRPAVMHVTVMHPHLADYCLRTLDQWEANNTNDAAQRKSHEPLPAITYEQAKEEMGQKVKRRYFGSIGRRLTPAAALRLAQDALAEKEPAEQARLLSWFTKCEFPLPVESLLPLAHAENENVRRNAVHALSQLEHACVRELALRLAQVPGREVDTIELLVRNGERPDAELLLPMAQRIQDKDTQHRFGIELRELFDEVVHPALAPALLYLYEHGPCAFCRRSIVQCLEEIDALSPALREECRYDSETETRAFIAKLEEKGSPSSLSA